MIGDALTKAVRRLLRFSLGVLAVSLSMAACASRELDGSAPPIEPEPVVTTERFVVTSPSAPVSGSTTSETELPASTLVGNTTTPVGRTYDSAASGEAIRSALGLRDDQMVGTGAVFGDPFKDEALTVVLDIQNSASPDEPGRQAEGRHTLVVSTGSRQGTKWMVGSAVEVELMDYQVLSLDHEACRIGDQPANDVLAVLSPEFDDGVPEFETDRWNATRAWRVAQGKMVEIPDAQSVSCELTGE